MHHVHSCLFVRAPYSQLPVLSVHHIACFVRAPYSQLPVLSVHHIHSCLFCPCTIFTVACFVRAPYSQLPVLSVHHIHSCPFCPCTIVTDACFVIVHRYVICPLCPCTTVTSQLIVFYVHHPYVTLVCFVRAPMIRHSWLSRSPLTTMTSLKTSTATSSQFCITITIFLKI